MNYVMAIVTVLVYTVIFILAVGTVCLAVWFGRVGLPARMKEKEREIVEKYGNTNIDFDEEVKGAGADDGSDIDAV